MIIGIDVGGTHVDGVLVQGERVIAKSKVPLDGADLEGSIFTLLTSLLPDDHSRLQRIHLSTTLCTNALIHGSLDRVGMFIQAGPGMNPDFLQCGDDICFLTGAIDHRGQVLRGPNLAEVEKAAVELKEKGVDAVGIVTKFSHRNNEHELWIRDKLVNDFSHISMGHRLSGMANFPRRVYTTWLNSGLMSRFGRFRESMEKGFARLGINCPCCILKADGGTISFDGACAHPGQTIHSGPSASVMGSLALAGCSDDAILLDIGGTSTDIALFADGIPLLEPYGATVGRRPTLIRALLTRSVGLGGDSSVRLEGDVFHIGPQRHGPPMAFGGEAPTPTDAMVVLGTMEHGDAGRALQAMSMLRPDNKVEDTAKALLQAFCDEVRRVVDGMIEEVFSRPVYTVAAFLEREKISPRKLIVIGGPAAALKSVLEETFALPCVVPDDYEVANAVGAARTRQTVQASLYADSTQRRLYIPEISAQEPIDKSFTMEAARKRLDEAIVLLASGLGDGGAAEVDFIEQMEMNTVKGFASTGKIISLKAQIRPGLAQPTE